MSHVVELPLDQDNSVLVEVDDLEGNGVGRVARPVVQNVADTLSAALDRVKPALELVVDHARALAEPPQEVSVQFGIKLSAHAGVVVAQAATEAHFTVTARWTPKHR